MAALKLNASSARSEEEAYHEGQDTSTTSDDSEITSGAASSSRSHAAMRCIPLKPFGLRRQGAISFVTPPRRTVLQYACVESSWELAAWRSQRGSREIAQPALKVVVDTGVAFQ